MFTSELISAGGLYNGHGHPIADKLLAPFDAAISVRPYANTFFDRDLVTVNGPYTPDLVLCLCMDDETRIAPEDIAEIVMVLDTGGIVVIQGTTQHSGAAAWQSHILPLLGGGRA